MGMFGNSKRPVFKPSVYQPGRRSRRMPRWLVLLFTGIVLGAGGVLFLQTNYGPQRLTAEQSEQLRSEVSTLNSERQRLQAQLSEALGQREASKTSQEQISSELAQANQRIAALTQALQVFQEAVPPDPRGGDIGVRWGEFRLQGGRIDYRTLLMRESSGPAFQGQIVIEIAGSYRNGKRDVVTADPAPLTLDRYALAQGTVPLPEGFVPRTATIRVIDAQEHLHAMRIYYVRGEGQAFAPADGAGAPAAAPPVTGQIAPPPQAAAPQQVPQAVETAAASAAESVPAARPRRIEQPYTPPQSELRMTVIPAGQ